MLERAKKNIFVAIVIACVIYIGLIVYADYNEIISVLGKIEWYFIILFFMLSSLSLFIKYLKWEFGLSVLGIQVDRIHSFQIFTSSLTMSLTPGKIGDLIKSYMLKKFDNVPISKTSPIVLLERITEFVSLLFVCVLGVFLFKEWIPLLIISILLFLSLTAIIANEKWSNWVLHKFSYFKIIRNQIIIISEALSNSRKLFKPKPYLIMFFLSLFSWIIEGSILYFILFSFGIEASFVYTIMIFAFSILIGSISMLPGGLGLTEGSMTFLLVQTGITNNISVSTTLIFRITTLWFSILLGTIALTILQKKSGSIISEDFAE